jgi:hypothetical protein
MANYRTFEATIMTTIDLGSELLIDRSTISDPYVRLAVASCGQAMVRGSQWMLVNKQLAVLRGLLPDDAHLRANHS